jgi:UPF0755 protein
VARLARGTLVTQLDDLPQGDTPAAWHQDPWDDPDATDALMLERTRRSRQWLRRLVFTVGFLVIIGILVGGGVALWYVRQINPAGEGGAAVTFTIEADDTLMTVSQRLEAEGLIVNDRVFRWYTERSGGLELTPGYYRLRPLDHMGNLLRVLRTPPEQTFTKVTFPEGYTLERMAERLNEKVPRFEVDAFMQAANDPTIASLYRPEGTNSLEGLLFPDTYQVSNGESPRQVVTRMVGLMERVGRQEGITDAPFFLTPYQVLIVASLIEREAKVDEDRAKIARVIYNRLGRDMALQIDATLYYQQNPDLPFSLLKATDTPYNTYLYKGLPPTPIANPGRASIRAALNPANDPPQGDPVCAALPDPRNCPLLYYVLADEDGRHVFASTVEQHEANVEAAREAGLL